MEWDLMKLLLQVTRVKEALNQLQTSVGNQIKLSIDDNGKVRYTRDAEGPLTEGQQQLVDAIDDSTVKVNINATDSNVPTGGTPDDFFIAGAFGGNEKIAETDSGKSIISTTQDINTNDTNIADNAAENSGATVLHEVIESYLGGVEAQNRGLDKVEPKTGGKENPVYDAAHAGAPKQSPIRARYFDSKGNQVNEKVKGGSVRYYAPNKNYYGGGPTIFIRNF